jgi:hypothetical protein
VIENPASHSRIEQGFTDNSDGQPLDFKLRCHLREAGLSHVLYDHGLDGLLIFIFDMFCEAIIIDIFPRASTA